MATVLGIKKSYDDWFEIGYTKKIKDMCEKYDLKYKFDWIFKPVDDVSKVIDGGKKLPTTKSLGEPYNKNIKEGQIHIFFSKNKKDLEYSYKNGWYPLIMNERAIHKPYIDILRFGYFLGYPNCCIDFFRRYNNWNIYNNLYEVLKNTKGKLNKFCNPILKDSTYSYIYHMPCSYNCKKTIEYVKAFRKKLIQIEPEFINKIDEMIQKPLLVINEQNAYIFKGNINNNTINYSDFGFAGVCPNDNLSWLFKKSDKVKVLKNNLKFYCKGKLIKTIPTKGDDGFILDFSD
jgi:hypothetical protein